jgi:hypothetical protein
MCGAHSSLPLVLLLFHKVAKFGRTGGHVRVSILSAKSYALRFVIFHAAFSPIKGTPEFPIPRHLCRRPSCSDDTPGSGDGREVKNAERLYGVELQPR